MKARAATSDSSKKDAILSAALDLFAEKSFHGTTVPEIAERAKVGLGTVYRYFESKESLVNALFQQCKMALADRLYAGITPETPVREVFHEMWQRLGRFSAEAPTAHRFLELHHHAAYLNENSRLVELALLRPMAQFIEQAQKQQVLKDMSPPVMIALVYGAFVGLLRAQQQGFFEVTPSVLDQAEACVWEAIRR